MERLAGSVLGAALLLASSVETEAGTGRLRNPGSGPRLLDFCVSVRFQATASELENIQRAFTDANVVLADATDGQCAFGHVDLVNDSGASREAEVWILPLEGRAYATSGLFGTPGEHVTLYYESNLVALPVPEGDAYTIAHEFLHHVWGVKDEYVGPGGPAECEPFPGSPTSSFCLLDNFFTRGGNNSQGTGSYTLDELCVASNHDPDMDTFEDAVWESSCWERLASHPIRALLPPPDLPEEATPAVSPPDFRFPEPDRRYVLCVDRSSDESATGDVRLTYEKQAATLFAGLVRTGDKLAVTSFAGAARTDFPLTEIAGEDERSAAIDAIDALMANGVTNLAEGIIQARDVLTGEPNHSCTQTIILLTDGRGNAGVDELSLIPSLIESDISVIAIAVGQAPSVANVQRIAIETGGRFLVLPVLGEFAPLVGSLTAELFGGGVTTHGDSTVAQGETVTETVTVDTVTEEVTFLLAWPNFNDVLGLTLVSVSGDTITAEDAISSPNIDFVSDEGTQAFIVSGPEVESGDWGMNISGDTVESQDGGSFCFGVLASNDEAVMVGAPERPVYTLGESVRLFATPRFGGNSVAGAEVTGGFTRPDGTEGFLTFADDGASGDDVAGDGIYTALFSDFMGTTGAYSFDLKVANVDGFTNPGEPVFEAVGAPVFSETPPAFVRLATASAVVEETEAAPVVTCSGNVVADCSPKGTFATVEATVFDADGDALVAVWSVDGQDSVQVDEIPSGNPPTLAALELSRFYFDGIHVVTVRVSDGKASDQCASTITVRDETPPTIDVILSHDVLWPPDGRMVDVEAFVMLDDHCDPTAEFVLSSIRSDEPDDGKESDIEGAEFGTPDTQFRLRARRFDDFDGRTYTITYTATDAAGRTSESVTTVVVPHFYFIGAVFGDEAAFTPDGTDLQEQATACRLFVLSEEAERVDSARIALMNGRGTIRPQAFRREDLDRNGSVDLVLEFSSGGTRGLRELSGDSDRVGLGYLTDEGRFYWTEDIFGLGAPLAFDESTGGPLGTTESPLYQAWPNPFRESTSLSYNVPAGRASDVEIVIYDVLGRQVRRLLAGVRPSGVHTVSWDATNDSGDVVPAGVYFYRIATRAEERVVRVILLR
jgi:hypothetical protein